MRKLSACRWRAPQLALIALVHIFGVRPSSAGAASVRVEAGATETHDAASHDGGSTGDGAADASPAAEALRGRTAQIQAMLEGRLDVDITPSSLFEVAIDDDQAVDIESGRLAAMLQEIDDTGKGAANKGSGAARTSRSRAVQPDSGAPYGEARPVDPEVWSARIEFDRATLQFLGLPKPRREEVLGTHAERQAAAARARVERPATDAERAVEEAALERQKVLEEARLARVEAERRISEEYDRLLAVGRAQTVFEASLATRRQDLAEHRDILLGWRRRAVEAREERGATGANADTTYDELRKTLRRSRDALARALDEIGEPSAVPTAGRDPLAELHSDVDASQATNQRKAIETEARRLQDQERQFREQRLTQLLEEIGELNKERLALQSFLSAAKQDAITGFDSAGIDQGASEVRQLALVFRYHRHATVNWFVSLRRPGQAIGSIVGRLAFVLFQWLLVLSVFVAWRRRAPALFTNLRQRAEERDRDARRAEPTVLVQGIAFLQQVRRPLEWLILLAALGWLVPGEARELLEVQLLVVILRWTLIGSVVVNALNAVAGTVARSAAGATTSALRLRSLRLVGRVVVVLGLVLVISSRLVGKGTIYQWVWSTCWIASLPVFLLLVRWWRETVFVRAEAARKKSTLETWLLAHRTGWKSFPAAMVGGVYLFVYGSWRAARGWVGRFDVTRRVLAYLFRRELDKLVEEQSLLELEALPGRIDSALGPDQPSDRWVATDGDARLDALIARLREKCGGVIAVVGERGMGKTEFLRRIRERVPELVRADMGTGEGPDLLRILAGPISLPPGATLRLAAERLNRGDHGPGILVDGAERLVRPAMGGLAAFDEVMAVARHHSSQCVWVLTFDQVIWQFLERARGARPLFDEVIRLGRWREEEIALLLRQRTAHEGVTPNFDLLLDRLPANADDFDKEEALARREASYYRLIWDYAGGNPGVALHTWRRSLGMGKEGKIYVKLLQALDSRDLDALPDAAVFVLRAVLQLKPATADAICAATLLRRADVEDALRYALGRGYVADEANRYVMTWTWFRPMTLFLQRRHLLAL